MAVVLTAGYTWYRVSDTGERWRYEDKLATYCDGLIPYEESADFTGAREVALSEDRWEGFGDGGYYSCRLAVLTVNIGLIPDDAVGSDYDSNILSMLDTDSSGSSAYLPVSLGGGWRGYTDMRNTAVVLPCANKPASVAVSIAGHESHENPPEARAMAELAATTSRKAAARWSCDADFGGPIPKVWGWSKATFAPGGAEGACKGIRVPESQWVDWMQESDESSTSLRESCVLGESKERDEEVYYLSASYGPYAQRLRSATDEPGSLNADAGISRDRAWATASCPDMARAIFRISATVYAAPTKSFLKSALKAFAERSAARHGCTDLKLPA
ncbi:hypothetical protein [Streptomyces sp. PSKA30]|uniref:hypothetical protein n=1 Tax=Streptomyces sp. PSKA30 TaxID=2874597 RepID=UPI001CD1653F|nr:hypothetical protein [Streptomyces sp. PSKA30]MBZ9641366.1 hypothetical protein [Streptomyces sp. PSKA30]